MDLALCRFDSCRAELRSAGGYNSWVNWFIFLHFNFNINNKVKILVSYSAFYNNVVCM